MKTVLYVLVLAVVFSSCSNANYKYPHIVISTKYGDIEAELYADKAPKSVAAFISYIDSGYYKDAQFYRVLNHDNQAIDAFKAELIQGGIWRNKNKLATSLPGIPHESTKQTGIKHLDGTLSLAREQPGTATTEFFICVGAQPGFDFGGKNNADGQGYAAFGRVVKGMDVVKKIYNAPDDNTSFDPPVMIYNIEKL